MLDNVDQIPLTEWDEANRTVIMYLRGFTEGELFQQPFEHTIKVLNQYKATRLLLDLRAARVSRLEDQNWLVQNWQPRLNQTPVKRMAIVVPADVLGKMSLARTSHNVEKRTYESIHFDDIAKAQTWLNEII